MDKAVRHVVGKQVAPASIVAMTASNAGSAFRLTCRSACRASPAISKRRRGREFEEFPELLAYLMRRFPQADKAAAAPEAQSEIDYHDLEADHRRDRAAQPHCRRAWRVLRAVHDRASPGIISTTMLNAHYASHDAYLDAIAREMSKEYQAVHKAGLILQIDAPDLAMDRTMMYRDLSDHDFVKRCERHVAAINKGIEGIPRDRVRLHVCYGNWEGPHITTFRWRRSCRRSTPPTSARSPSSSPTRATPTNIPR